MSVRGCMTIYFVYCMLALSACVSVSIDISAAAVEQKEVKEKSAIEQAQSKHKRRRLKGERKKLHIDTTYIVPGTGTVDRRTLELQQEEDTPLMKEIMAYVLPKNKDDHAALERAYEEIERLVVKERVDVGAQTKLRETPLMRAVEYNNRPVTLLLLSRSAVDKNAVNQLGDTALMYAVREGNADLVDLLLKYQASPLIVNREGWTALMMAARRNDVPIVKMLLAYMDKEEKSGGGLLQNLVSEQLALTNNDELTALYIAHQWKARDAEKILAQAAGVKYYEGWLLIHAAGEGDVKTVEHLLAQKVDVNYQYHGQTALLVAVNGNSPQAMLKIVTLLLQAGANPDRFDGHGKSPLMILAGKHFDKNWQVHWQDALALSALQCRIIEQLLQAGAAIEGVIGKATPSPLIEAITNYNLAVAEFLVSRGANIQATYKGKAVIDWVTQLLITVQEKPSLYDQWMRFEFDLNLRLDPQANTIELALFQAINYGDEERVAELLKETPPPNLNFIFLDYTPLIFAIDRNNIDILQQLINARANINQPVKNGFTPLMVAVAKARWSAAICLIEHRADVNSYDYHHNTALMYFAFVPLHDKGCLEVLKLLLDRSNNVNARNKDGKSALDFIQRNQEVDPSIKKQAIEMLQKAADIEKKVQDIFDL